MRAWAIRMVMLASVLVVLGGCEKLWLDRQMKELCAKDGGVKVYETVKPPPEMFDQHGDPFPGWKKRVLTDNSEFLYEQTSEILNHGDPSKGEGILRRLEWRIRRKADGKVLGMAIVYVRTGGDFIVLGHPSGKKCPGDENERDLIKAVFVGEE